MKNQIMLDGDVYDISNRLKEIDETYFVVYNLERKKYEVHSNAQKGGSYCFSVPFDFLDARTLEFARKTRTTRREEIIKELDRENDRREKRLYNQACEHLREVLE